MQNVNCINCKEILPGVSNLYFCPSCASQIKCRSCNEMLLAKAKVCINCGVRVNAHGTSNNETIMNEIDFEQKGNHKTFKSKFTNEVGNTLAETFAAFFGGSIQYRKLQNPFTGSNGQSNVQRQLTKKVTSTTANTEDAAIFNEYDCGEILQRYFALEDGKLKLINSRLKHTGKLDQAIRLALLSIYAFEKAGQSQVEKSILVEIISSIGRYDTHFQGWFSKCDEIIKDGSKISLTVPGRETAEEILKELADDSITTGAISFSRMSKRGGRKNRKLESGDEKGGDSETSKSRASKGPMYYLDQLVNEGFFSKKRKLGEIIEYLKTNKAESYKQTDLSTPLKRAIKAGKLKRDKNSDKQYEYFA